MAGEPPHGGGLQRERTRLAWRRTALSFVAVGALLLRDGLGSAPVAEVPGVVVLIFAGIVYALGAARARRSAEGPDRSPEAVAAAALTLAVLAVISAALSMLVLVAR